MELVMDKILISVMLVGLLWFCNEQDLKNQRTIKYDCRLAEISVDYPQQVKEQCRKLLK
jgi:hypothetical protein